MGAPDIVYVHLLRLRLNLMSDVIQRMRHVVVVLLMWVEAVLRRGRLRVRVLVILELQRHDMLDLL
jgi:hypothetical protein